MCENWTPSCRVRGWLRRDLDTSDASRDYIHLYRGDRNALVALLDPIQRAASTILGG